MIRTTYPLFSGQPTPLDRPAGQSDAIVFTRRSKKPAAEATPDAATEVTGVEALLTLLVARDAEHAAALDRVQAGLLDLIDRVEDLAERLDSRLRSAA